LLVNDSDKNTVMFCKTSLQFLSPIDVLYVDGTFKTAPKFFSPTLYNLWTRQRSLCATCIVLNGQ